MGAIDGGTVSSFSSGATVVTIGITGGASIGVTSGGTTGITDGPVGGGVIEDGDGAALLSNCAIFVIASRVLSPR